MKLKRTGDFDLVLQALQQIRSVYPSAIIAGGAVRDLTLDSYVKDYDVFVHKDDKADNKFHDPYHWEQLMNVTKPKPVPTRTGLNGLLRNTTVQRSGPRTASLTAQNDGVNTVFKIGLTEHVTVDIIITNVHPITYVREYFDIGICKAYTDGARVFYTPDFIKDVENKTISIVGKHMTPEEIARCEVDHAKRVKEKFPGHTVVYAPHVQQIRNKNNVTKAILC